MSIPSKGSRTGAAAIAVGVGILLSRIAGFIRDRVFAYYLGNTDAAGAFRAALRIPNLLQNLFGEGVLSASFIPVYTRLRAEGKEDEAKRLAGSIFSLLLLSITFIVGIGVVLSRPLIDILAPGFDGDVRELTVRLVRILFPGAGLLVLSAWCLGVLNSHRKFLLSYVAPVVWNVAIITTLLVFGAQYSSDRAAQMELVELVGWGTVVGSLLQFLVQLPKAIQLNGKILFNRDWKESSVQRVLTNFLPALLSRGVVQLSAYIDQILSSFLGPQMVSAMAYAQTIALLPISLFGMSVSSAELPELSSLVGEKQEVLEKLKLRLEAGLRRISFYVVPSVLLFFVLGDAVVGLLFQNGKFQAQDTQYVWWILAGYSVGILSSTLGRMCVSVFWALHDTKTPAKYAFFRVLLSAVLGVTTVFVFAPRFHWAPAQTAAILGAVSGLAGWAEFLLIRSRLSRVIGRFTSAGKDFVGALTASVLAAFITYFAKAYLHSEPIIRGSVVVLIYGSLYLLFSLALRVEESRNLRDVILRRLGRK